MVPLTTAARLMLGSLLVAAASAGAQPPTEYVAGRWWNGVRFISRTMYVDRGTFRASRPREKINRINLAGGFVIPPLAEGHNHWLEPAKAGQYSQCYLADGVFYVRDMASIPLVTNKFVGSLNRPDTVDFTSVLNGFSGPGGHPVEIIDQFVAFGILPSNWKADYDGVATAVVRTRTDIDRGLANMLPLKPTTIKAFLLFSENYAASLIDPSTRGNGRGMDPALLPYLVRRAHASHVKVAVHIYSAFDFRTALAAGADEIAHLPGTGFEPRYGTARFRITLGDARAAARANIPIDTTLTWLGELKGDDPKAYKVARDQIVVPNLKLLLMAGARLVIGSDSFRHTSRPEFETIADLGVISNARLLRINSETIRVMFPGKRLGSLTPGYRADFLVLKDNPLENIKALHSISMRIKQGQSVQIPPSATARPSEACVEGTP